MRNIANVVHDLAPTVENLELKTTLIADKAHDFDQEMFVKIMASIVTDVNLLKDYMQSLKEEARLNQLSKAEI